MCADWPRVKISDVCELIVDCVNKTAPHVEHETPYKMVRTPNIKNGNVDLSVCRFVEEETYIKWTRRAKVLRGDVLLTREAPMGQVGYVDFDQKVFLGQRIMQYRVKPEVLDSKFLLYSFLSPDLQHQFFMHEGSGSVVSHIRVPDCSNFEINIPPIEIQKKIAKILWDIDKKIKTNTQTNQTLETIAQTLFKSWFVDFDPVKAKISVLAAGGSAEEAERAAMCAISARDEASLNTLQTEQPEDYAELARTAALFPSAMQDSELGEIPEGWGTIPLYETAEYVNGAAFKAKDFTDDSRGLPIIKIAELKQGISSSTKFTKGAFKDKYALKNGDVLYSWSGSPETSLEVFKWFGGSGWLNQHIFKLNFISDEQKYFAYYLLKHMKPILIATAKQKQTTGLGHITVADMKRLLVVNPSINILKHFADKCSALYNNCSNLDKENDTLAATRDTLLPKLLSGELTLSDDVLTQTNPQKNVMLKKPFLTMGVA